MPVRSLFDMFAQHLARWQRGRFISFLSRNTFHVGKREKLMSCPFKVFLCYPCDSPDDLLASFVSVSGLFEFALPCLYMLFVAKPDCAGLAR